jgi:hypothetical protein
LCSFLKPLVISSFLGPNIFLRTLLSNTLGLCTFLMPETTSHTHKKTTDKIIVLYILIFYVFRQQTRRQNILNWMATGITQNESTLNFHMNQILIRLLSFQNIFALPHFQRIYLLHLCYDFALNSGYGTSIYTALSFLRVFFQTNLLTSVH